MKRTPLNKKSNSEFARAKACAWEWFSKYIRLRDSLRTTGRPDICKCITCGAYKHTFTGSNCIQAGHWLCGRTGKNLFEENAVHGQCVHCNKHLSGNNTRYTQVMQERYGQEECDRIVLQANLPFSYLPHELRQLAEVYRVKFTELRNGNFGRQTDATPCGESAAFIAGRTGRCRGCRYYHVESHDDPCRLCTRRLPCGVEDLWTRKPNAESEVSE